MDGCRLRPRRADLPIDDQCCERYGQLAAGEEILGGGSLQLFERGQTVLTLLLGTRTIFLFGVLGGELAILQDHAVSEHHQQCAGE